MANPLGRLCSFPFSRNKAANQAGAQITEDSQGRYRIRMTHSGARIDRAFETEEEAKAFVMELINQNGVDLDGASPIPFRGEFAGINRLRPGEQPALFSRASYGAVSVGIPQVTPLEKLAQNIEAGGLGKAYTGIFDPTHKAKILANKALAFDKQEIPEIGGKAKSYQDWLLDYTGEVNKETDHQRRLQTLWGEAFTKEELVRPGALTANGLDQADIEAARIFERLGMAEEIPNLMRTNLLIDNFLENRAAFAIVDIPKLRLEVLEGKLDPEILARLERVIAAGGTDDTYFKVLQKMGLSGEEQEALVNIRNFLNQEIPPELAGSIEGVNKVEGKLYNIPAIGRYAAAPVLDPKYKTGRAQFAVERKMTERSLAQAEHRMKMLKKAYADEGLDADMLVGAQYPILRQYVDAGIYPWQQYGAEARGSINAAGKMLRESLPEASDVFTRRVLSGHMNPYEMHPAISANKHIRNLIFRKYLDPAIEKAEALLPTIPDGRLRGFMKEYLHTLEGIPDKGFRALNDVLRTVSRFVGGKVDDQLAERIVSILTKTASQAAIPLRAGLVIRNFMQTTFTLSIMGPEAWTHGLRVASGQGADGFNPQNLRKAIEDGIRAGVIDPNTIPLHAHSEMLEGTTLGANLGPAVAQILNQKDKIFDAGFSLYRYGDDWGRVVAYNAGKFRVAKHLEAYMGSARDEIALETFKRNAKVKTFHEVIEGQFDQLIRNEQWEAAKELIGVKLADKAHFMYANATHPIGWGGPVGKLFGQFGTFPTQYLQLMIEGTTRGTVKDKAQFLATQSLVNMGLVYAGAEVLDADLQSWSTFGSLQYAGGPYADIALNLMTAWSGNDAQRGLALRSLQMTLPSWENPATPFLPGSYFASDIRRMFEYDEPFQRVLRGIGIRPLDGNDTKLHDRIEWVREILPR